MPKLSEGRAWQEAKQIQSFVGERGQAADYDAALAAIEEQRVYDQRRRHVAKISEQLAPDPSVFHLEGYQNKPGVCACGQKITHRFILKSADGREVTIGSTCIDATVPYLISMGAQDLAETVREQWKRVIAEMQRDRRERAGREKLKQALPDAAVLDHWYQTTVATTIRVGHLPPYFRRYRPLPDIQATTPARRAALMRGRMRHFLDRLPLVRAVMKRMGREDAWINPLAAVPVSDGWMEAWEKMNEWRDGLKRALQERTSILASVAPELVKEIEEFVAALRPIEEREMTADREKAKALAGKIPTTAEEIETKRREMIATKVAHLHTQKEFLATRLHQLQEFHLRHRHDPKWHKEHAARTAEMRDLKDARKRLEAQLLDLQPEGHESG